MVDRVFFTFFPATKILTQFWNDKKYFLVPKVINDTNHLIKEQRRLMKQREKQDGTEQGRSKQKIKSL